MGTLRLLYPQNRPVVDFNKVAAGEERGGALVTDDRSFANIIIGPYQKPQPGNKGHYTKREASSG